MAHDPSRVTDLAAYRKRGGEGRSNVKRARKALSGGLRDIETAQAVMLQVLIKLYTGKIDPPIATAMASVARAICDLAKTTAAASMEEQLTDMARQIADLSERRPA